MKKRWLGTIGGLAVAALAVGAVPALTADNGTVTVTVTAEAAAAPCLALGTTTMDFGTLAFSTPAADNGRNQAVGLTNCGTANENITASGTNATSAAGAWALVQRPPNQVICSIGPNKYSLVVSWYEPGDTDYRIYTELTTTAAMLANSSGPYVFQPTQPVPARLGMIMPCQGSNGPGETKNFSVTFTAVSA